MNSLSDDRFYLSSRSPNFKAHSAMLASSLIFGVNYWIAKGLMPDYLTPEQIMFFRVSSTALLFWLVSPMISADKPSRKELLRIALCSMMGVVLNQYFFFLGLRLSNPVETAILHTTNPILVLVFAAIILHERITLSRVAGIALGAAGALLIVLNGKSLDFSSETSWGNLFILLNMTFYSLYLVLIKPVMQKHHPVTVMKWAFLFAAIAVVPFTFRTVTEVPWSRFTADTWFSFLFVVIATTFLAYFLVSISLKRLSPAVVGFYTYTQPLIASIHGIILEKEKLSALKVLAALLIFTGVYFVNRRPKRGTGAGMQSE